MFRLKIPVTLLSKHNHRFTDKYQKRNIQVSLIGAANKIGQNVALLLKQNMKISKLKLFDFDPKVMGIAQELHYLPGGPLVVGYNGENDLPSSISLSKLILIIANPPANPRLNGHEILQANANDIYRVCKVLAEKNATAVIGIFANPLNSVIPFVSSILHKRNALNPLRLFGITHIDMARTKAFTADILSANPRHLQIPVIGGHSEETVVPLLSNLVPDFYTVDSKEAEKITHLVKKADLEVIVGKGYKDSSILALAWSIHEFADKMIDAISGHEVELHTFTANPNFGTRYFAGPTLVGCFGTIRACSNFPMSNLECNLLANALPFINKDVAAGEELARWYT